MNPFLNSIKPSREPRLNALVEKAKSANHVSEMPDVFSESEFRLAVSSAPQHVLTGWQIAGNTVDATRIGVRYAFFQSLIDTPDYEGNVLFQEATSAGIAEDLIVAKGAPAMQEWLGDRPMSTLAETGFRVVNKHWANGITVKRTALEDQMSSAVYDSVADLGSAARHSRAAVCGELIKAAFPGSGTLCFDGKTLIAPDHSAFNGPVVNNYLGAVAFNTANIQAAFSRLRKFKSYEGTAQLRRKPTHVIVGPDLESTAMDLFAKINQTAGQTPSLAMRNIQIVVVEELADLNTGGCWFVADLSRKDRPLYFQRRQELRWKEDYGQEFNRDIVSMGCDERFGVAPGSYTTIVGANPA